MSSWRDVLKIHPACELFPLMSAEELKVLGEDIKANGLKAPIAIWCADLDAYERNELFLLDGRNRLDAMEAVGLEVVHQEGDSFQLAVHLFHYFFGDRKAGDPFAYVISTNIHRRHLTADQKRDLVAGVLKAQPERSDRAIASITKVDHKTVAPIRADLERRGEIPHVEARTDTKGRQQPVRKPKTVSVKPPPPSTPAQRVEEKIRRAGIADKKEHGDLSLDRVMDEVVAAADPEELIALANHSAPERHIRARAECDKQGVDWDSTPSAGQTAEERKALYADEQTDEDPVFIAGQLVAFYAGFDGFPALPMPTMDDKSRRRSTTEEVLANTIFSIVGSLERAIFQWRDAGRLPELFCRVRKIIDKLEADADAEAELDDEELIGAAE
jgi:hypothetical protein